MARKRTSRHDLPERVYYHHNAYYYVSVSKKWIRLGTDYVQAMASWAALLSADGNIATVGELLDRYIREVIPLKAERTQQDNLKEIRFLRSFFSAMPLVDVAPSHIAQYRDAREAKTRGNREIALLSHALSKACEWGLLANNPCREVKRNKERARDRYVTDDELARFKEFCPVWMTYYLDFKLATGLRQQDLLKLQWGQVSSTHIEVTPAKTQNSSGKKIRIIVTPELAGLLDSLSRASSTLFTNEDGKPLTTEGFRTAWQRAQVKFAAAGNERFHEHDLRGKVATDMGDTEAAKKLLGHTNASMTEAYIRQRATDEVLPLKRRK